MIIYFVDEKCRPSQDGNLIREIEDSALMPDCMATRKMTEERAAIMYESFNLYRAVVRIRHRRYYICTDLKCIAQYRDSKKLSKAEWR